MHLPFNSQHQVFGAVAGVHEIDAISAIHAQFVLLTKNLDGTNVSAIQTQNPPYDAFAAGQPTNEGQTGNFWVAFNRAGKLREQLSKEQ